MNKQNITSYIKKIAFKCLKEQAFTRWPESKLTITQEEDDFVALSGKGEPLCCLKHIVNTNEQRVYWAIEKGSHSTMYNNIEDVAKGFEQHITGAFGIKRSPVPLKKKAIPPTAKKILSKKKRKCSICKQPGHNKRTCPQK